MSHFRQSVAPALWFVARTWRQSPVRSLIVVQGVVWATVLGVTPPAIIRGSREAAIERARSIGTDRVLVYASPATRDAMRWKLVDSLRSLPGDALLSAAALADADPLLVVDSPSPAACGRRLVAGRWLSASPSTLEGDARPCAISRQRASELFGDRARSNVESIVGETFTLAEGATTFRVDGVVEPLSEREARIDAFGLRKDHPFSEPMRELMTQMGVFPRDLSWRSDPSRILVRESGDSPRPDLLELRVTPERLNDFMKTLRKELLGQGVEPLIVANPAVRILFSGPMDKVERLHTVIFLAALFSGTIIVANTLVLTILGRRAEIAIRRVEGATKLAIATQLVLETSGMCLAGAVLGLPLALGIAEIRCRLDPSDSVTWIVPVSEALQTVLCVTLFGVLGGWLPAWRAARIQPVEVLSHE